MPQPTYYTGYVRWGAHEVELIDVLASDREEAERKVRDRLQADYQPGGVVEAVEPWAEGIGR